MKIDIILCMIFSMFFSGIISFVLWQKHRKAFCVRVSHDGNLKIFFEILDLASQYKCSEFWYNEAKCGTVMHFSFTKRNGRKFCKELSAFKYIEIAEERLK